MINIKVGLLVCSISKNSMTTRSRLSRLSRHFKIFESVHRLIWPTTMRLHCIHRRQPVSEPTQPLHEVSPASERGSLRPVIQQLMKDVSQLVCQLSEIEKRLSSA
ncbi:hypothetical protein M3Y97_00845100 [Aphelenchoides bicaudatus]|nr:hypothetical protein M3Y97_00845100 [Aphelenchoides bicaudatus]